MPAPTPVPVLPEDGPLVVQALAGDEKAFRTLVNRNLPTVYNFLYRMAQTPEQAEEWTQDTFVKVYKNLKTYDTTRPFKPWVLRIASNTAVSALRKEAKVVSIQSSLDGLKESGSWAEPAAPGDTAAQAETRLVEAQLQEALGQLDPKYRQVLLLRYTEDLSYEEISDAMAVPLNTVRTWLRRGRDKLMALAKELTE